MIDKIIVAARLTSGLYTPFLSPTWEREEFDLTKDWLNGKSYPDVKARLTEKILLGLDGRWRAWFVNLGRSAIQIALEAMKLPGGSEVLLPSFACTGVVMPVIQAGLRPVFIDVDEHFNARLESILEADSPKVRAVIVPHLSGCWAKDFDAITDWARSRDIFVVEDAAQSQGLMRGGRPVGTFGDVGVFSINGGKLIFGSGGGWLITRHPDIVKSLAGRKFFPEPRKVVEQRIKEFVARYIKSTRARGQKDLRNMACAKLKNKLLSSNRLDSPDPYRFPIFVMSDIEAALLLSQMRRIEKIIEGRRKNAGEWRRLLTSFISQGLRVLPEGENIHTKMLIFFLGETAATLSHRFKTTMFNCGVETEPSYTPLHLRPPFTSIRRTSMPNTEKQWQSALSLPVRPNLTSVDWERIYRAVSRLTN